MLYEDKIWMANTSDAEHVCILPKMANRHGLVAGATGTGKTVTLKVMAEAFSDMGVPVFMADVKGDIAGMMNPGADTEDMRGRIERFGLADKGFSYCGYPVTFWDVFGQKGIQLRSTVSELGPLLLSRILNLNDLQSSILSVVFKIADDNDLLLIDTKDLKSMLSFVEENAKSFEADYGKIGSASLGVIKRNIVSLETEGGDVFFGEPALNIADFLTVDMGRGMINILDSSSLVNNRRLYSTFLLWMMSELYETLPEVGDLDKPKLVFFFDEAHLLFSDAPKVLVDKIEQMVKLIRSKGVGIYFCTQNPRDIPDNVLAQLGNKVEHGLRAYTPNELKAVKAAAETFRVNPDFNTYDAILSLGTGEAVVSFLDAKGVPGIAQKVNILPPRSFMGTVSDSERDAKIKQSLLYTKYSCAVDNDSAYEFLERRGLEMQAAAAKEAEEKAAAEQAAKEAKEAEKAAKDAEKAEQKKAAAKKKTAKQVGGSIAGTVGREVGKTLGKSFGKFGKTLGGNVGASLGRGLLSTLFKL